MLKPTEAPAPPPGRAVLNQNKIRPPFEQAAGRDLTLSSRQRRAQAKMRAPTKLEMPPFVAQNVEPVRLVIDAWVAIGRGDEHIDRIARLERMPVPNRALVLDPRQQGRRRFKAQSFFN